MNFAEQFRRKVAESPKAMAIRFKDQQLSYEQLAARIEGYRSEFGSVKGMRVIILLPDSLETYLFYLFLFLEEAVTIPLSVLLSGARIANVVERVQPHLILTNELLHRTHQDVLSATTCFLVGDLNVTQPCGFAWHMPGQKKSIQEVAKNGMPSNETVRMIIFTSGSTGIPKGVCLSESNLVSAAGMMVDFLPVMSATKSMVTVPLYDYYGLIQIFGHIIGGGGFMFGFSPAFAKQFHRVMHAENVTDLVLVPHTLRKLTDAAADVVTEGMRSLKRITTSSDILTEDLLVRTFQANPGVTVVNIYGLTEAGRACYRKIGAQSTFSKSIGRASKGVEIVIEGEAGEPGEIIIRGPNVMLGYFQRITDGRVEYKPYTEMRTGDLGYFDEAGEIVLLGRRDHMINLMGAKIHPSEIEMAALKLNGIQEAKARVVREQAGDPTIHLDVVSVNGPLSTEAIKEELRKTLPRMFVPTTITLVPEIARTELGAKILREKTA